MRYFSTFTTFCVLSILGCGPTQGQPSSVKPVAKPVQPTATAPAAKKEVAVAKMTPLVEKPKDVKFTTIEFTLKDAAGKPKVFTMEVPEGVTFKPDENSEVCEGTLVGGKTFSLKVNGENDFHSLQTQREYLQALPEDAQKALVKVLDLKEGLFYELTDKPLEDLSNKLIKDGTYLRDFTVERKVGDQRFILYCDLPSEGAINFSREDGIVMFYSASTLQAKE